MITNSDNEMTSRDFGKVFYSTYLRGSYEFSFEKARQKIVKHNIEAHNETMLINSTFSVGSEFSFTLKKAK